MPPTSADNTPLIVGAVVGSLLLLVVVALVVFLLKRHRSPAEKPAPEMKPQGPSNYAAIKLAPLKVYDEGRLDSNNDQPAPSNYDVVPATKSSEYNVGRLS
jgi:hypothetical protein